MATESAQSTSTKAAASAADAYIGSFISLISKSEIRYEGVLFHINPHDSTIGLKNVRSFGTEGRKNDGLQVLPSDRVYDYIYFRGGDIKDLQVLSSLSMQSTAAIPDDPAIIQSHYSLPAPASESFPSVSASSITNLSTISQPGLQGSIFQGSVPQYQPVGNIGSWFSSPLPNVNSNEHMYWQRLNGPSGPSHLQQQSLLRPPTGLLLSPGQQQVQYSTIEASKPSGPLNIPEVTCQLLPSCSSGSLNLTSTSFPTLASRANIPDAFSALLSPNGFPNNTDNYETNVPPVMSSSSLPIVSSLTSALDTNNITPEFGDKTASALASTSSSHSMSASLPSILWTSGSNHTEAATPSLVTPAQLFQLAPTNPPTKITSSFSLQTAQKDIEVVQASTSEPLSTVSKEAQEPLLLSSSSASNGKLPDATLHTHHGTTSSVEGRENKKNGVWNSYQSYRAPLRGRRNVLYGTISHTHLSNKGHARGAGMVNRGASQHHYSNRGRPQGRKSEISRSATRYTEDFDFVAMNEKFNKDEVWGELCKSLKGISKENDDRSDSDEENIQHEDAKAEIKPVYVKDEFFDSLSFDVFNQESKKGRLKFAEQRRIDVETFGNFQMNRGGRGGYRGGRGSWSRGSRYGRGHDHGERSRGRAVWSHVT